MVIVMEVLEGFVKGRELETFVKTFIVSGQPFDRVSARLDENLFILGSTFLTYRLG